MKDEYFDYLTDFTMKEKFGVSDDVIGATTTTEKFISFTKIDKEREDFKKWLGDVSGPFTVE